MHWDRDRDDRDGDGELMSGDIGLFLQDDDTFDVEVASSDLSTDEGMQTAVIMSLFTDRQVETDDLPIEETSVRGWWGDLFPEVPGDKIGSRLWLLKREKRTVETLNRAEEYALEALQWMIDDGVADSVEASASWDSTTGALLIQIMITKPKETLNFKFKTKWSTEAERS